MQTEHCHGVSMDQISLPAQTDYEMDTKIAFDEGV